MTKTPLHSRINWPADVDMQNVAVMIAGRMPWRCEAAGLHPQKIRTYYNDMMHSFDRSISRWMMARLASGERIEQEIAAMWYAVMKTAIETYGLKW